MNGIAIYMEGGGNGKDTKAALRQGMDAFLATLKEAARAKSWHWKLVCCGGRQEAFNAFIHALGTGEMSVTALLVDAEGPATGSPGTYLTARDGWDCSSVSEEAIHLMIETMETWIVADVQALATYYGQHFHRGVLPKAQNLETIAKQTIATALERATRRTQKKSYHKIRHASDLLRQIDPVIVRQRCPGCARMFCDLNTAISEASD
jgi:hypothetical protein